MTYQVKDPRFETYLEVFRNRVRERRLGEFDGFADVSPVAPTEVAFTEIFLETLEDIGQLSDITPVYFEKKLGRYVCKLNGFCFRELDGLLDLVVTVRSEESARGTTQVSSGDVESSIKRALQTFRAAKAPVHKTMEPSSVAYDMMEVLHDAFTETESIRVTVLVDGLTRKELEVDFSDDLPDVQVHVWDLERLYRADSSGLPYEPFTIHIEEFLSTPLICLAAPAVDADHRCYLTVIPGTLLHDLYHLHGPRLLELNVRSFLQARGKVNRGIRDTLLNDSGHFLAFNNGISVTAESIDFEAVSDGVGIIRSIRGLQVVNGGQTVASIHRAKNRDKADLSNVFVQAKITVVTPERLNELVPHISRYSNTQNKVNETDFSANHPFHVQIQKLSEQIWVLGETSRWFYERARGQWEVARAREGATPAKLRAFDEKIPRFQKVDKTLLSKAANAWDQKPHIVSLGGQKSFVRFMEDLRSLGDDWLPDESYYKQMIAKVIVYKLAEKVGRGISFAAYRANAVCYSVSLLSYRTAGRIDLASIWSSQKGSQALEETLRNWMPLVHDIIVESAGGRNVTEWCKKRECWSTVQGLEVPFAPELEDELTGGLPLPTVGAFREDARNGSRRLTEEERSRQARTMQVGPEEWVELIKWGRDNGQMTDFELKLAGTLLGYSADQWRQVPSPKQTRYAVAALDRWSTARVHTD